MASHHTLLTIGAMTLLSTVLLNFYRFTNNSSDDINRSEDVMLAATVAASYLEVAQGLAFDSATVGSNVALSNLSALTDPSKLGPETADEDSIAKFNDFDDFNGFVATKELYGTNRTFTTRFTVSYVNQASVGTKLNSKTFVKRMETATWRSYPPYPGGEAPDTLKLSTVLGYFHFD